MNRPAPRLAALAGLALLLWTAPPPAAAQATASPPAPGKGVPAAAPPEMADSLRAPWRADVPDWPARPRPAVPLLLDSSDFGFGASVMFDRMPDMRDLHDVGTIAAVQHVVVSLPEWPAGYEALQPLAQALLPEGADLIVILPGYPPSHAAAEAWNYLRIPLRIVMVVDGPPASRGEIDELNRIRGLERVIADMADPSRSGFERLQRPLSFRVVMR
jgi:hypothetical protein